MRKKWSLFLMSIVILLGGCDYSHKEDVLLYYLLSQWICYFTS